MGSRIGAVVALSLGGMLLTGQVQATRDVRMVEVEVPGAKELGPEAAERGRGTYLPKASAPSVGRGPVIERSAEAAVVPEDGSPEAVLEAPVLPGVAPVYRTLQAAGEAGVNPVEAPIVVTAKPAAATPGVLHQIMVDVWQLVRKHWEWPLGLLVIFSLALWRTLSRGR